MKNIPAVTLFVKVFRSESTNKCISNRNLLTTAIFADGKIQKFK